MSAPSDVWHQLEDYEKRLESGDITAKDIGGINACFKYIGQVDGELRSEFGRRLNQVKVAAESQDKSSGNTGAESHSIDIHAPFDVNSKLKRGLPTSMRDGGVHPIAHEMKVVADIFARLGFNVETSRQVDDDFHMFESLNFPEGHPARDDWDTFNVDGGFVAPAHTSTMQNRILMRGAPQRSVVIGRVFRNEDLDARHEHTLHQIEVVIIDKDIHIGNLLAILQQFLSEYYQTDIEYKTQPAYFPFVEPGLEFALSCPFCLKAGCKVCSHEGWIELLGCGMIHPNVLKAAGVDSEEYSGFAAGFGLDRLLMMKYDINDIRLLQSGRLDFLDNFRGAKS